MGRDRCRVAEPESRSTSISRARSGFLTTMIPSGIRTPAQTSRTADAQSACRSMAATPVRSSSDTKTPRRNATKARAEPGCPSSPNHLVSPQGARPCAHCSRFASGQVRSGAPGASRGQPLAFLRRSVDLTRRSERTRHPDRRAVFLAALPPSRSTGGRLSSLSGAVPARVSQAGPRSVLALRRCAPQWETPQAACRESAYRCRRRCRSCRRQAAPRHS